MGAVKSSLASGNNKMVERLRRLSQGALTGVGKLSGETHGTGELVQHVHTYIYYFVQYVVEGNAFVVVGPFRGSSRCQIVSNCPF